MINFGNDPNWTEGIMHAINMIAVISAFAFLILVFWIGNDDNYR